ncbi:MAG: shikimate kinase [Nanoarchaeota archaeon]|nr:shikimate kinase [Nanoarchaeota archaeon]
MTDIIYIIGYRAAGKTAVSELLGKKLKKKVIYMDDEITKDIGRIDLFVKNNSWEAFRYEETNLLEKLSKEKGIIIDCGGGVIVKDFNISVMKDTGKIVWLKADINTIIERLKKNNEKGNQRPSLTGKSITEEVKEVIPQRLPLYRKAADFEIVTDGKTPEQIVEMIIENVGVIKK